MTSLTPLLPIKRQFCQSLCVSHKTKFRDKMHRSFVTNAVKDTLIFGAFAKLQKATTRFVIRAFMSVCAHVRLCSYPSVLTSVCAHVRLCSCPSVLTSVCAHVRLCSCPSVLTSVCAHVRLCSCLSVLMSICPSVSKNLVPDNRIFVKFCNGGGGSFLKFWKTLV